MGLNRFRARAARWSDMLGNPRLFMLGGLPDKLSAMHRRRAAGQRSRDQARGQTLADAKTAKALPGLLDHAPVRRALGDPTTRYWLRDQLISARSRDPVDTLADLDTARDLLASYLGALVAPPRRAPVPRQSPDGR